MFWPIIYILGAIIVALILLFGFTAFTGAPYVPSLNKDLDAAFTQLYRLQRADTLIDLGSGDGKVLRAAARRGATSIGVELNPLLALYSRLKSRRDPRISVHCSNLFHYDFPPETTVVYLFGDGRDLAKFSTYLCAQAAKLNHPLHVISYGFQFPASQFPAFHHLRSSGPHHLYRIASCNFTVKTV